MNRKQSFKPCLSELEDRLLLRTSFTFDAGAGLLKIDGDRRVNRITINDNGAGNLSLNLDGAISSVTGVKEVRIRTAGGDDRVTHNLNNPLTVDLLYDVDLGLGGDAMTTTLWKNIQDDADLTFKVKLEGGTDTFDATLGGDILPASTVEFNIDGGLGPDKIQIHANNDVDVSGNARLKAFLTGGPLVAPNITLGILDADVIKFEYDGELDGILQVQAKGGVGEDNITADINLQEDSDGEIDDSLVDGQRDNDDLVFLITKDDDADDVVVQAAISGGFGGNDEATYTAGFVNPDNSIEDDNAV